MTTSTPEAAVATTEKVVNALQALPPSWVTYLAALLTPTVAALGLIIAYLQWRTARRKLDLDLFNRRFSVYEATSQAMSKVARSGKISMPEVDAFTAATRGAQFLFDAELEKYLEEVRSRLEAIAHINETIVSKPLSHEDLTRHGNTLHEHRVWLRDQWSSKSADAAFKKLKPLDE